MRDSARIIRVLCLCSRLLTESTEMLRDNSFLSSEAGRGMILTVIPGLFLGIYQFWFCGMKVGTETTTFSVFNRVCGKIVCGSLGLLQRWCCEIMDCKGFLSISISYVIPIRVNCFVSVSLHCWQSNKLRTTSKHSGFEKIQHHISWNGIVLLTRLWYDKTIHLNNVLQWDFCTIFLIC